jgi:hypothetical protein
MSEMGADAAQAYARGYQHGLNAGTVTTAEEREAFDRYVAALAGAGGGEIGDAFVYARDIAAIARELMLERRKLFGGAG